MAIQAQLYQDNNLGFPMVCGPPQDHYSLAENHNINACFNAHQKTLLYHPQQQQQHTAFQELYRNDNNNSSLPTTAFHHQRQEIDHYIKLQNERLREAIQEQRKREIMAMMRSLEPKLSAVLRQKEEEISREARRTVELQALLGKLEEENQTWQRIARQNEAAVLSLQSSLEQAIERAATSCGLEGNVAEDAGSCCESGDGDGDGDGIRLCKCCGNRESSVLFLPCRHFCSCSACETILDSCPVCREPKKATIQALT